MRNGLSMVREDVLMRVEIARVDITRVVLKDKGALQARIFELEVKGIQEGETV